MGRGKGRSSKRALSAGGSAGDRAVASRSTRVEAEEAWEEAGAPPGAEGLRGRAHSPADRQEAAGSRACRTSRTAGSPAFPSEPLVSPAPQSAKHLQSVQCPLGLGPQGERTGIGAIGSGT